jgi:hypothetical protein
MPFALTPSSRAGVSEDGEIPNVLPGIPAVKPGTARLALSGSWETGMIQPRLSDVTRQFSIVFAAIFQIYASYTVGSSVGAIAQEYRSFILPASYAFAIWGPIFILCGVYALYQALPAQRENRIFRVIGWWAAGAFLANGAWSYAYTSRQFLLAQAIIFAGFVFAAGSYLGFARAVRAADAANIDNWLIGPTFGLLFGWITAASVVGLAGTLIAKGFAASGQRAEIRDAALLLLAGAVAFFVILASRRGPYGAWASFAAAVLWALVAIMVEQRSTSTITTAAAAVTAVFVLFAAFGPWKHLPGHSGGPRQRPRTSLLA